MKPIKRDDAIEAVATEPLRHGGYAFVWDLSPLIENNPDCDVCAVGGILRQTIGAGSFNPENNKILTNKQTVFLDKLSDFFEGVCGGDPQDDSRLGRCYSKSKATKKDRELTMCYIAQTWPEVLI